MKENIIILTGPTGSGKSKLGLSIASIINGEIINSDSVQVYKEIPTISFAPTDEDLLKAPHHLYSFISCKEHFSIFDFLVQAKAKIDDIIRRGRTPILLGGSPMYQRLIIDGISELPQIKPETGKLGRNLMEKLGKEEFYKMLLQKDPLSVYISPNDEYRMLKAFEIKTDTNISITELGNLPKIKILEKYNLIKLCLLPDKETVAKNCKKRIDLIDQKKVIEEVSELLAQNIQSHLPARKAIGIQEIEMFINKSYTIEEALEQMLLRTIKYVKKQYTWFNNKYQDFSFLKEDPEEEMLNIFNQIGLIK